jgi:hypothetical protein
MPLTIPRFLQARDLLSALVAPGNLNASGEIVFGTAIEMAVRATGTGTWKAFEFNGNPALERFTPSDLGVANYQNEYEDFDFTIREITPVNGMGTLTLIATTADFVRVDYIYRPRNLTTGAGTRLVAVGTRGTLRNGYTQGENTQELGIKPVGFGVWVGLSTATPPI